MKKLIALAFSDLLTVNGMTDFIPVVLHTRVRVTDK